MFALHEDGRRNVKGSSRFPSEIIAVAARSPSPCCVCDEPVVVVKHCASLLGAGKQPGRERGRFVEISDEEIRIVKKYR